MRGDLRKGAATGQQKQQLLLLACGLTVSVSSEFEVTLRNGRLQVRDLYHWTVRWASVLAYQDMAVRETALRRLPKTVEAQPFSIFLEEII